MKCFEHPETQAVGVCKNCNKGLCHECAVDTGFGLACKEGGCVEAVQALQQALESNIKATKALAKSKDNAFAAVLPETLLAIISIAAGIFMSDFSFIGIVFVLGGIASLGWAGHNFIVTKKRIIEVKASLESLNESLQPE